MPNTNSNSISVYAIDQATGSLIPGTTVATGTWNPYSITVDPSGRFAYVADDVSNVWVYAIDQATGALIPGTTVTVGTRPLYVNVDPSGRFAYVANTGSNNVSVYAIDRTDWKR